MELIRPDKPSTCTWSLKTTEKSPHTDRSVLSDRMKALPNVLHAIGQTPLVQLHTIPKKYGIKCEILAKCEYLNPGGSVKDRIGFRMIQDAEDKGILKPGYTIIEPTSGNTGIGLAMAAAIKGYRCIIVMPEKMSNEKVYVLKALGAEIVRTPTEADFDSPDGHIATSQKLQKQIPNSVILDQYTNPGNPLAHYDQTGNEIWKQCEGKLDYAVIGAGTGGTVSGIARRLKEKNPNIQIIGVDPAGSILAKTAAGHENVQSHFYEVEGIGYDFIPTTMDLNIVDKWIEVNDHNAFKVARELIKHEGLLVGGSSGANVFAALEVAKNLPEGKRVVVVLPDNIRNYMTKFVSDHWMEARGFLTPPEPVEQNKWWWNMPVSSIQFEKPLTLQSTTTCGETLLILQNGHHQQLPVVDEQNQVKGVVELNKLYSGLISGQISNTTPVEKIVNKTFRNIDQTDTLCKLSRVLELENYAIIVNEKAKQNICGLATQSQLYDFICNKVQMNGNN